MNTPFRERSFYLYFRLSDDPVFLARAYGKLTESAEALAALNGFVKQYPNNAHLHFARAATQIRLNHLDQAGVDLKRATADLGQIQVARLLEECAKADRLTVASKAAQIDPQNLYLRRVRSDELFRMARWDDALEDELSLAEHERFADRVGRRALIFAVLGMNDEYRQARRVLIERMLATLKVPWQDVYACLLQPTTPAELQQIEGVYEWRPSVVSALADPMSRYAKRIEGMIEYRRA